MPQFGEPTQAAQDKVARECALYCHERAAMAWCEADRKRWARMAQWNEDQITGTTASAEQRRITDHQIGERR